MVQDEIGDQQQHAARRPRDSDIASSAKTTIFLRRLSVIVRRPPMPAQTRCRVSQLAPMPSRSSTHADSGGAHHHAAEHRRPVDPGDAPDRPRSTPHGFTTTLIHGRLGDGEGDMSYLLAPGARRALSSTRCAARCRRSTICARCVRLYRDCSAPGRRSCTRTWPRPGMLGRIAAAAYNLTRGAAPRARVVHTYHGHVLEGYFSPLMTAAVHHARARAGARQRSHRRDLAGDSSASCSTASASAAPSSIAWSRSASTSAPFAAIDDAARAEARRARAVRGRCRWSSAPLAG